MNLNNTIPVILLNYNSLADCRECVADLKSQEGVELEIVIVDNCSPLEREINDIRKNETTGCIYCNGTGRYSNPNERHFSSGTYRCQNCGQKQSYSSHHSCVCKKCGGKGSVKRW